VISIAGITFGLGLALSLVGCASTVQSTSPEPSETPKQAFQVSRDVHVCIDNASGSAVKIAWQGVDSSTGEGTLRAGTTYCGLAAHPDASVTFSDGTVSYVKGSNFAVGYPSITFVDVPTKTSNYTIYAQAYYSTGETVVSDVQGHHFSVTRAEDSDWINFNMTILD
jgi:hypothetical protein